MRRTGGLACPAIDGAAGSVRPMRRARTSTGIAPAMISAETTMTAYNTQLVCEFPAILWKPRPRSASATQAAGAGPPPAQKPQPGGGPRPTQYAIEDVGRKGAPPPPIGGISADHQQ